MASLTLASIGTFLTSAQGIATVVSTGGSILGGIAANNAAGAEAESMEIEAGQRRAAAQRDAERKRKEAQVIMSRQQAVAAASGGGATDQTVLDLMARTAGEGELQAGQIQYQGEEAARGLRDNAAARRMQGRQALFSSFIDAGSSALSGFNNWNRYYRPGGNDRWRGARMPTYRYG